MTITIRPAQKQSDFIAAHQLIAELALYEKAPEQVILTLDQFIKDGTAIPPLFFLNVAEVTEENGEQLIVGICLFYFSYSTWKGKMVYLDDLVITEKYRRLGIGKKLVNALFQFAKKEKVNQVRWHVLDWNTPAINFYKKLGLKLEDDWITCKFSKGQLENYPMP